MSYPAKIFTEPKDPGATGEWGIDWSAWLAGDTIAASVWEIPAGIEKVSDRRTGTVAYVKLKGGTAGKSYDLTNTITTTGGTLIEPRTIRIHVEER